MTFLSLSSKDIIIILLSFISFLITYVCFKGFFSYRQMRQKISKLSQGESALPSLPQPISAQSIMKTVYSQKDILVKLFGSSKKGVSQTTNSYRDSFEQAGWDPINAIPTTVISKLTLMGGAIFIFLFICNYATLLDDLSFLMQVITLLVMLIVTSMFFDLYLKYKIHTRYTSIRRDLPFALDLLVICATAGLAVDKTFEQVAREIGRFNPHLGTELALTSIELSLLPDRRTAYENLARRVKIPLVFALATTLTQAEEQGTSFSATLSALTDEFRTQSALAAEARAGRLPALLSVPIVLFTLPCLLIIVLGPSVAAIYRSF